MEQSGGFSGFASVARYLVGAGGQVAGDLIACRYEDAGVSAVIAVRAVAAPSGGEWLALSIPIAPSSRVAARAALVATGELPIGALALWQDVVLLRQTLPIAGLLPARLAETMRALAHTAAVLVAAAGPEGAGPFAYVFR